MTKMNNSEMKSVIAGHPPELVECICVFMDAGMDYNEARIYCLWLLEQGE